MCAYVKNKIFDKANKLLLFYTSNKYHRNKAGKKKNGCPQKNTTYKNSIDKKEAKSTLFFGEDNR